MKKLLPFLLVLLLTPAFAQTPYPTVTQVFDRLYATEVACSAAPVFEELLSNFRFGYCGYINDELTDINKRWTLQEMNADGYVTAVPWQTASRSLCKSMWSRGS